MGFRFQNGNQINESDCDPTPPARDAETARAAPSLMEMAKSATEALAKWVGAGGRLAPQEERDHRRAACLACDQNTNAPGISLGVCRACGCVLAFKTTLPGQVCPLNRWSPTETPS